MKLSVAFLLVLGVVAAVCAALLVSFAITHGNGASAPAGPVASAPDTQTTVLVARRPLPAMTVISEDCVNAIQVPKSQTVPDSYAAAVQVNGKLLVLPMVPGQPFTASCFVADGMRAKFASALANGKRAFAINITDHGALDGILYPGSIVDVLTTAKLQNGDAFSTTLLSAVEVLAIEKVTIVSIDLQKRLDSEAPSTSITSTFGAGAAASGASAASNGVSGHRVTLQVDSKQAKTLQVAMENGTLALALRNPTDSDSGAGEPVWLAGALGLDSAGGTKVDGWSTAFTNMMDKMSERVAAAPPAPAPTPMPALAPTTAPAPPPDWEITILRGGAVETRHFAMPHGERPMLGKAS
jgi:Flp pilus assembly protein CpaB